MASISKQKMMFRDDPTMYKKEVREVILANIKN